MCKKFTQLYRFQEIRFEAISRPGVHTDTFVVAQLKKGPVAGGTAPEWNLEMVIPSMEIYNFDACSYIDVSYNFKVSTPLIIKLLRI